LSIWPVFTSRADGADLTFRRHDVNLDSTFPACAALDVNRDGRLDIVCGGWWYEAPHWEAHFLREVSIIRGRYDDYSNLPLDVDGDGDGDGDQDLICPGRSGLCWLENRFIESPDTDSSRQLAARPLAYEDHADLMVFQDERGRLKPLTNPSEWGLRRAHILAAMQQVMGPLPEPTRRVPLQLSVLDETPTAKYVRRKVTFAVDPDDRATAYLLVPHGVDQPAPAVLCLHQTTSIGKDEPAGLGGKASLHYAHELANQGYVCIVPDYPSFGDDKYDFRSSDFASGSMKAIWNNVRSLDVLETMPEVDPDRIGCIGHSLGGHNALFTAVFDLRIKAVVTSCGFTAFHSYKGGNLAGWTSPRYMPRIATAHHNDPDQMPFDFHEIVAALAPRPVFINAPIRDDNFDITGVREVVAKANRVYELVRIRETDQCTLVTPDCGHDFPDDVRMRAYQWLSERL
jgi:dienelactone hydrolase